MIRKPRHMALQAHRPTSKTAVLVDLMETRGDERELAGFNWFHFVNALALNVVL